MTRSSSSWLAIAMLVAAVTISACGGPSASPPTGSHSPSATAAAITPSPTAIATPVPTASPAVPGCPGAAVVGDTLGTHVDEPTTVANSLGKSLPSGAKAVACKYAGNGETVLIELFSNIASSNISLFSNKFPVKYTSVKGVGDQARAYSKSLGGGKQNIQVVATKGKNLVSITALATLASLSQIEALVTQLL